MSRRKLLYIGALVLGVTGYLWFRRRQTETISSVAEPAVDIVSPVTEVETTQIKKRPTAVRTACVMLASLVASLMLCAFGPMALGWEPVVITTGSMQPMVKPGDIVVINPKPTLASIHVNDLVTYRPIGLDHDVTHRVIAADDGKFMIKGDANRQADSGVVNISQIQGKAELVVPLLGKFMLAVSQRNYTFLIPSLLIATFVLNVLVTDIARLSRLWSRGAMVGAVAISLVAGVAVSVANFKSTTSNGSDTFATYGKYPSAVMGNSPVSWWRMDDASGNFKDFTGYKDGGYVTAPQYAVTGAITTETVNKASNLGVARATVGDMPNYDTTGNVTVELWYRPAANPMPANARLLTKNNSSTAINFMIAYNGAGTLMRFITDTGAGRAQAISTTSVTDVNKWYHLVGTWDGTTAKLYINGTLEGSDATKAGARVVVANQIGVNSDSDGSTRGNGRMDEMAYYNSTLSAADVLNHYTAATVP